MQHTPTTRQQWRHAFGAWRLARRCLLDEGAIEAADYAARTMRAISGKWDLPTRPYVSDTWKRRPGAITPGTLCTPYPGTWRAYLLQERVLREGPQVRVIIGASHAYACITTHRRSLDVQLQGGRSAVADLRRHAEEDERQAARLLDRAALVRRAAQVLEVRP